MATASPTRSCTVFLPHPVVICLVVLCLVAALPVAAQQRSTAATQQELPAGLTSFLKARLLEANDRYAEAVDTYAEALRQSPDSVEIRIAYAALMLKLGSPDTARSLLIGKEGLDWYGKRTLALAMIQLAIQQPDLALPAEDAVRDALEERPDDSNLLLAHAQILHRMGRYKETEAILADLRATRGDNPQVVAFHASVLQTLGRTDEAIDLYRQCLDSPGRGPICQDRLVELLVDSGRLAEAGEAMLGWLAEDELDQLLEAAALLSDGGRVEQALGVVRKVLAAAPGSVRARTYEALLLSGLGRFNEASEKLKVLLADDQNNVDLLLPLAWAEAQRGQLERARDLVDRAWQQCRDGINNKAAVRCCLTAARIELAHGKALVAREWLERAPDKQAGGAELVRLLAETYRRAEEWQDGMAAMLRLQPMVNGSARLEATAAEAEFRLRLGSAKGYQRLRSLLYSTKLDEVLLGLQVLQTLERWQDLDREAAAAITRIGEQRDLVFLRAAALERLQRLDEAEVLFLQLLERDPDDVDTANYLGYMWADSNTKLEQALELILGAVETAPDNAAYIDSLGWIYYRLGKLQEAEHWLRRATALGGGSDGTVIAHLGEVLLRTGRGDEARLLLQQALDLGCEHPDHVRGLLDQLEPAGEQ